MRCCLKSIFTALALLTSASLLATEVLTEFKAAYFHPESARFRDIYSKTAGIYGAEVSVQTYCNWYTWASGDIYFNKGKSLSFHDKTNIYFVPIGLGFKYLYPLECWDLYLGIGALSTYVHMRDHSDFVVKMSKNWGWGGILKAGAIYTMKYGFFLDLFTTYSYTHIGFHKKDGLEITRHDINTGGWSIGLGLGFRLGCRDKCPCPCP